MHILPLYLISVVGFAAGWFLMRDSSPYSRLGGSLYEKRMKRRLFGKICYSIGALCLTVGVLAQVLSALEYSK